jgi:hypothetical protein
MGHVVLDGVPDGYKGGACVTERRGLAQDGDGGDEEYKKKEEDGAGEDHEEEQFARGDDGATGRVGGRGRKGGRGGRKHWGAADEVLVRIIDGGWAVGNAVKRGFGRGERGCAGKRTKGTKGTQGPRGWGGRIVWPVYGERRLSSRWPKWRAGIGPMKKPFQRRKNERFEGFSNYFAIQKKACIVPPRLMTDQVLKPGFFPKFSWSTPLSRVDRRK